MVEIIGLSLIILASAASTIALLLLLPFLIPDRVERTYRVMQAMPGRAFVIGLVNAIFFLVVAAVFAQGGDFGGLIAIMIPLALIALSVIGLSGLVLMLHSRIYPQTDKLPTGVATLIKTASLLVMAGLLPFLGWFVLTPILMLVGLGASIIVLARRDGRPPDPPQYP